LTSVEKSKAALDAIAKGEVLMKLLHLLKMQLT
jgi:hypothetical protein